MNNEKTGKLIYEIRTKKNMTQKDIADKLYITSKAVSKWELGLSFPSVDILENLAEILDLSVTEILTGEFIEPAKIASQTEKISLSLLKLNDKKTIKIKRLAFFVILLIIFLCSAVFFLITYSKAVPYNSNLLSVQELKNGVVNIKFNEDISAWYIDNYYSDELGGNIYTISAWKDIVSSAISNGDITLNNYNETVSSIYYYSNADKSYNHIYGKVIEDLEQ